MLALGDLGQFQPVTPELLHRSAPLPLGSGPIRLSLTDAPERERPALLKEFFARLGFGYDINPVRDAPFEVDLALHALPDLQMVSTRLHGSQNRRTRASAGEGRDDIVLIVNLDGPHLITQGNEELVLGNGEAAFLSDADACTFTHRPPGDLLRLRFPCERFAPLVSGMGDRGMRRIPSDTPALRFLRGYFRVAWEKETTSSRELQQAVADHLFDLMAVVFGATRDATEVARGRGVRAARLKAIKDDIAETMSHSDLSLTTLASRHGLAPRCVQRLFEAEGTSFTEYVLAQRLARAHRLLCDPRRQGEKISAVAWDSGFGDLSYFNQAFRKRYGLTPSDVRSQARQSGYLAN